MLYSLDTVSPVMLIDHPRTALLALIFLGTCAFSIKYDFWHVHHNISSLLNIAYREGRTYSRYNASTSVHQAYHLPSCFLQKCSVHRFNFRHTYMPHKFQVVTPRGLIEVQTYIGTFTRGSYALGILDSENKFIS